MRGAAASGARARARSISRCGLAELWLRDVLCVCEGAAELVYAVDRRAELEQDADGVRRRARCAGRSSWSARRALSLSLNVSEELALEALAYRLRSCSPPEGGRVRARPRAPVQPAIGPRFGSRP